MAAAGSSNSPGFLDPFIELIPAIGKIGGIEPSFSKFPAFPQINLGFNHWIHKGKDKTEELEKPENAKRKEVVNPYEHKVIDYDMDIHSVTRKFFKLKTDDGVVSRAFYKLWELLMLFGLADNNKAITSIHLAEAPGAFVQATMMFREKYINNNTRDKHIATSIICEPSTVKSKADYVPAFDKRVTSSSKVSIWEYKDCDLTNPEIVSKLVKEYEGTAHLVTADGGFNWLDENYQEQEAVSLLLAEILAAVQIQAKGGSFVLKIFDIYTDVTAHLIGILQQMYDKIYLTKPLTSRPSNSERYLVCLNFQGIPKKQFEQLKVAHAISFSKPKEYITSLVDNYEPTQEFVDFLRSTSVRFSNTQVKLINETMTYIKSGNYFGDEYRSYLDRQRRANDFWVSTFYPIDDKDFKDVRARMTKLITKSTKYIASH